MITVKRVTRQPGVPAAVLAAAVVVSMTSAVDASVAAVVMQARQGVPVSRAAEGERFSQWLDRLTDAARQVGCVVAGQQPRPALAAALLEQPTTIAGAPVHSLPLTDHDRRVSAIAHPLRPHLTDLPPPTA